MPANVRSVWIIPNSDDEALLSSLIRDLAERFGTPVFAPHLTLRGGTVTAPDHLAEERTVAACLVPVGKTALLPPGLDGLRTATESARTGKPVAIEAVAR